MEQQIALLGPIATPKLLVISTEDFNSTELKSGSSTLLRVRVFSYCPPAASGVELNSRTAGMYEDVRTGPHHVSRIEGGKQDFTRPFDLILK